MAYAMVSTVNPNAKATPTKPMPRLGNAAVSTALPHPPKTSQNVPINSAVALLPKDIEATSSPRRNPRISTAVFVGLHHLYRIPDSLGNEGITNRLERRGPKRLVTEW